MFGIFFDNLNINRKKIIVFFFIMGIIVFFLRLGF